MHYVIFIPNKSAANRQNLIDAGLGDLLPKGDESPMCADLIGRGPGDLPGQVWAWGDAIPAYLPDRQTWTADKQGRFWLGITTELPPTPQQIMRRNPIKGPALPLTDGHEWVVPNVEQLPCGFAMDDQGEVIRVPLAPYRHFASECEWALDSITAAAKGEDVTEWLRTFEFAALALSLNYRLHRNLLLMLDPLTEEHPVQITVGAIDRKKFLAAINPQREPEIIS